MTQGQVAKPIAAEGNDIPNVYFLESLSQLKALAEPLRYRMCLLLNKPMTSAGLARELGIARAKAHYHLKQLEAAGLARFHSEGLSHGIVEKFYVIVGRMLDFSHLMPKSDKLISSNVTPETVGAVSDFLSVMLEVSRDEALKEQDGAQLDKGHYFDFDSLLTLEQFAKIKGRLKALRSDILDMTRENETQRSFRNDLVRFHLTNYLTLLTQRAGDGSEK